MRACWSLPCRAPLKPDEIVAERIDAAGVAGRDNHAGCRLLDDGGATQLGAGSEAGTAIDVGLDAGAGLIEVDGPPLGRLRCASRKRKRGQTQVRQAAGTDDEEGRD